MQVSAVRVELFDMLHFEYRKIDADPSPEQRPRPVGDVQRHASPQGEVLDLPSNGKAWSLNSKASPHRYWLGTSGPSPNCSCYTAQGTARPFSQAETGSLINLYA